MHLLFKALHLISMVAWFAGLFYMFRLFVYQVENKGKADVSGLLKIMSHRLYYYITWPAMVATVVFGFCLLSQVPGYAHAGWFKMKLLFLLGLVGYHCYIGYTLKRFKNEDYFLSSKQCRLWNEAPTLFLIVIILLAVYKQLPF